MSAGNPSLSFSVCVCLSCTIWLLRKMKDKEKRTDHVNSLPLFFNSHISKITLIWSSAEWKINKNKKCKISMICVFLLGFGGERGNGSSEILLILADFVGFWYKV